MDAIVIGCGASGVAALRRLHDAGLKVLGLEADDKIGGRISTVPYGDSVIDLGAAWCHGIDGNIVYELANKYDLLARPSGPSEEFFVLSNGEQVDNSKGSEIVKALDGAVAKAEKNNSNSISQCVRTAASTHDILKKDPQLTGLLVEWYERVNHLGGQSDPRKGKSLKGLDECLTKPDDTLLNWKGRGYNTILDILLNKYPDPSQEIPVKILLKKEVETIRWGSSHGDNTNPLVQVKCTDGSLYSAKSVIVTVSIGVLKERHQTLFNPPLPEEKIKTINTLQLCVLDKIYIEFEKPWFPKNADFRILWRDEDKAKFSDDEKWITEIYGMWSVENHPNVLVAWIYGNGAELMEKVSLEGVQAGIRKFISNVLTKFDVTPVKSILRTQWASNPLARGAYSYRSVAVEETGGSAIVLSEPLSHGNVPVVCFAGEASSHHRHNSVHGAIEAGFREADRLIDSLKKFTN